MPQSLLERMDYQQLKSLAEARGCLPEAPHNSEGIRKAIHDWEIQRGLPFKGLKDLVTKDGGNTELLALKELVSDLLSRVEALENAK